VFGSCGEAIEAFRARLPQLVELANAMVVAGLEIDGEYRDEAHDGIFESLGADEMGPAELAQFPDYLVCVEADSMSAEDADTLTEALAAGLPMKILLLTHDLTAPASADGRRSPVARRVRQIAHAAIGLGGVVVVQAAASHLVRVRERVVHGLTFAGPALFSVYSGAGGALGGLAPYLASAAATESRAFPAFAFEPAAGRDWASRFTLEGNPQPDGDWPVRSFSYEDETLQRVNHDVAFTLVDFLALDERHAASFAPVPKREWNGGMVPVPDTVTAERQGVPDKVPYLLMVDGGNGLHRVLVDAKLVREARRCLDQWRSLQELGGIHNSHAARLVARERQAWEEKAKKEEEARQAQAADAAQSAQAAPPPPAPATTAAAAAPAEAAPAEKPRSDEPYIETARCSTCNECTKINDRMFKYNANKQAFIADVSAGTYAQLVEAAESCQVAIIHPGKPKNPAEPNLDRLLERAKAVP
jgi:hypothetical protein